MDEKRGKPEQSYGFDRQDAGFVAYAGSPGRLPMAVSELSFLQRLFEQAAAPRVLRRAWISGDSVPMANANVLEFAASSESAIASSGTDSTPNWDRRFHLGMAATTIGVVAISLVGYRFFDLTLDPVACAPMAMILVLLALAAAQYAWRREAKCFGIVMMVLWVVLITNCHFFPMYMAARTKVPMNDAFLATCDRYLGVEVPRVRAALAAYPQLNAFLLMTYGTLIPLMTVATILPPILDRMDKAKEFVVGCILAASVSLPIFAFVQAVGPWEFYGFPPAIESLGAKANMLATLKTDNPFLIDVNNRDGLITFPSFHVVLTVLAAVALWPFRWLRWPVTIWAVLIVVSTVTTGIHYTIDVVGGLTLAVLAHVTARAIVRWEEGLSRQNKPAPLASISTAP